MALRKGNGRVDWDIYCELKREYESKQKSMRRALIKPDSFCARCSTTENLTVDHIISLRKGGQNTMDNLQVLCLACNRSKGAA